MRHVREMEKYTRNHISHALRDMNLGGACSRTWNEVVEQRNLFQVSLRVKTMTMELERNRSVYT